MRSWSLCGNSLDEVPITPNTPGVKNPADDVIIVCFFSSCSIILILFQQNMIFSLQLPYLFGSCYGVAVSPGNLVVAVV